MKLHKDVQSYIDQINSKISFKEAHQEIAEEVASHLEESINELKEHSDDESQAVRAAIHKMGRADEIGKRLNTVHRDEIHWLLIGLTSTIFAIGLFAMSALGKLTAHSVWGILGLLVGAALIFVKPTVLKHNSLRIYFSAIILIAIAWQWGEIFEGQPYFTIGLLKINAVNFCFIPLLVALAGMIERLKAKKQLGVLLFVTLVPIAGLAQLNSFYLASALALAVLGMMVVSGAPKWTSTLFSTMSLLMIFNLFPARFIDGVGLNQKMTNEAHTDFVVAYLHSHFPFLCLAALILGSMLLIQVAYAAREIKAPYSRTLAVGGLIAITFSFGFGILANFGFVAMPMSGVNIPFLSYGGSLTLGFFALTGVLVSIYRRKSLVRV